MRKLSLGNHSSRENANREAPAARDLALHRNHGTTICTNPRDPASVRHGAGVEIIVPGSSTMPRVLCVPVSFIVTAI